MRFGVDSDSDSERGMKGSRNEGSWDGKGWWNRKGVDEEIRSCVEGGRRSEEGGKARGGGCGVLVEG